MKIYFAMPVTYYQDPGLADDVAELEVTNHEIYVPSSPEDDAGYKAEGMDYFRRLIKEKNFNLLLFRSFANGRIGKGVADEIGTARNLGIPVCEFVDGIGPKLLPYYQLGTRKLTVAQTRYLLKVIRESEFLDGLGRLKKQSNTNLQLG